ncbi:MAG: hypothetical protein ACP5JU_02295 [Minisyncoccia bacterium]
MENKGQLENFFIFIITLLLILFCITYYFYFKTGTIPVFTPVKEIKPAEKSLLPPGTFFPKKEELPFLFFKKAYAKILKPSKDLDTFIISGPNYFLEDNIAIFKFSGKNYKKPLERLRYQTFLYPLDKNWQDTYGDSKIYYLPKNYSFYIFFVRARNDGYYDPSPAYYFFITKISNYYKDLSIYGSYDGYSITIRNNSNKDIDVTNWYVKTLAGLYKIPKAVKYFYLDKSKNFEEDIVLKPGDTLKIISVYSSATSAPLNLKDIPLSPLEKNFLGNKCFIYLNRDFKDLNYPAYTCDRLSTDEIFQMRKNLQISESCARYLYGLGCFPSMRYIIGAPDSRCRAFLEDRFNYNSCIERHKDDKDFWGNEWRVYIDTRDKYDIENRRPIKPLHFTRFEEIELYDSNGLIVNRYKIY